MFEKNDKMRSGTRTRAIEGDEKKRKRKRKSRNERTHHRVENPARIRRGVPLCPKEQYGFATTTLRRRIEKRRGICVVSNLNDGVAHVAVTVLLAISATNRLRRLVLCILHSMFFVKEKNESAAKNSEGRMADICDVISRDYIVAFP